jgi:hypothetical protein
MNGARFFGKYRGKVESNVDTMSLGRVQVSVPAVLGEGRMSWAMPCVPYAGPQVGLYLIPPRGANVWVEFEAGDPDYPIWSGCFWGSGELPAAATLAEVKVLKTDGINLVLSDVSGGGGVTLEVDSPSVSSKLTMVFDANGIELTNGSMSIKLTQSRVSLIRGSLVL